MNSGTQIIKVLVKKGKIICWIKNSVTDVNKFISANTTRCKS